jgi:excisionase family DNA binding protein
MLWGDAMTTTDIARLTTITPSSEDTLLAQEGTQRLAAWLARKRKKPVRLRLFPDESPSEAVTIPPAAVALLQSVLQRMAGGEACSLLSNDSELTTQQAADLLHVSRPFLIEQLEKGLIPFRKVGTHRRVQLHDLMSYKRTIDEKRLQTLQELAAQAQELGMGY